MGNNMDYFNVPKSLIVRKCEDSLDIPEYRTEFMRDRDRVMYATAFRRLAGKTQIYTVGADDHRRNRLTHTLEVAQIARTITRAIGLNEDLAEAIAFAHDLGHAPFGHAGERMLHNIMIPNASAVKRSPFYEQSYEEIEARFKEEIPEKVDILSHQFGFKHNLQSVRVSAVLENSYQGEDDKNIGLNLTNFTLYGMMIHSEELYDENDDFPNYQRFFDEELKMKGTQMPAWSFEAYIVKRADNIAQWHHDLEDAIRGGALPLDKICSTIEKSLNTEMGKKDKKLFENVKTMIEMDRKCIADLSHIVVNTLVNNLIRTTKLNFDKLRKEIKVAYPEILFKNYDSLGLSISREQVVAFSDAINTTKFDDFIKGAVHHSRNVERMNEKGKYIIRKLFEAYYAHPQQLPDGPILHIMVEVGDGKYKNVDEAKKTGIGEVRGEFAKIMENPDIHVQCVLMRRICDHIASMTDRYAIEEYNNLYG